MLGVGDLQVSAVARALAGISHKVKAGRTIVLVSGKQTK